MLSPLGPALCEEKRGEGKKKSDLPLTEAFYGFPLAFILFSRNHLTSNTCQILNWFQWTQCFKLAQNLGTLLSLWRDSNETEWSWSTGLSLSKTYPQIYFLEYVVALRFYIRPFQCHHIHTQKEFYILTTLIFSKHLTDHNVAFRYIDTYLLLLVS